MKLYYVPGACSLAPLIALHEFDVAFEAEKVDLATRTTESGTDFNSISEKGKVPTLVMLDGEILTEGAVILSYLSETFGKGGSQNKMINLRIREWLTYIATEIHKSFAALYNPNTPEAQRQQAKEYLERQFAFIEGKMGTYMYGDVFTVADSYLYTMLRWAPYFGVQFGTRLSAYRDRMEQRPSVQRALLTEQGQA